MTRKTSPRSASTPSSTRSRKPRPSGNRHAPSIPPASPRPDAPVQPPLSDRLFRALTDHSWDRVALLDSAGIIRYSSPSSQCIYGYPADEFLGRNYFDFVHPDDLPRTSALFRRLLARPPEPFRVEFRARRKDAEYIWMESTGRNLLLDPAIRAIVINERDITAGKRADAALLASLECGEAMIRATSEPELLERICAAIVKMGGYRMAWVGFPDPAGRKNLIPAARAGAGQDYVDKTRISWAAGEPRGQGPIGRALRTRKTVVCRDIARDPRFAPWRREALRRGYSSIIALPLLWRSECIGSLAIYSDQSLAFQKEETLLLQNLAGDIAYGLIALRTRAERELLQREILHISEREQRRIAQDLHDGVCQQLIGISYLASALHRRFALRNDPDAPNLARIAETLRSSAADARALSHCVHPVGPAPDAIVKALATFARVTSGMFDITCRFISPRPVKLPQETAANLYRIAQEAVTNAIKHGASTRITIRLIRQGRDGILLSIRDNGTGIPTRPSGSPASGIGLQIMSYRASMCGGILDIRKSPPRGTLVTCRLPPSGAN